MLRSCLSIMCLGVLLYEKVEAVKVCKTFHDYIFPNNPNCWQNNDTELNVTQIIQKWGFTAEEYYLTTEDGYEILVVRSYYKISRSTPIIIGHGIHMNSLAFVDIQNKSLTHILITMGYEVWLINFRGTRYSSKQKTLTTDDLDYWYFSFHEMGVYDLPLVLDLVYKTTHQKSIYVGFSMGTTVSYVYASIFPDQASQVLKGIISLAPIVYLNNIKSAVKYGAPFLPVLKPLLQFIWNGKILPRNNGTGKFCSKNPITMHFCELLRTPFFGTDYGELDPVYMPVTSMLNPDTIGLNVITHYAQIYNSGEFQQMNFGKESNLKKYGTETPPPYDISNITVPITLFVGLNDYLATQKDAEHLRSKLIKSKCNIKYVDHKSWNHGDFTTAKDIKPLLNEVVSREIVLKFG